MGETLRKIFLKTSVNQSEKALENNKNQYEKRL